MRKLFLLGLTCTLTAYSFRIGEPAVGVVFLLLGLISFIDFFL